MLSRISSLLSRFDREPCLLTSGGKSLLNHESPCYIFTIEFEIRYRPRFPDARHIHDPDISCHRCTLPRSISEFQCSMPHTPVRDRARQSITWVTYKQEYLRGSLSLLASLYMCTCTYVLVRIDAATVHDERETLCIGFAGQWVVASRPIAPRRLASRRLASPRYASLEPDVTAARFIASVNLRRLTSRRVSGYLSTYPPTYLSIYLSIHLPR